MITEYLLEIIIFQLAFLLMYEFWLQKETFFNLNRAYLLVTPVISFLIPFIRIESLQQSAPAVAFQQLSDQTIYWLPEVFIGNRSAVTQHQTLLNSGSSINWWLVIYLLGVAVTLGIFIFKLSRLLKISKNSTLINHSYYKVYSIPGSRAAYTFFNSLYIGDGLSKEEKDHIISHELVHLNHKHTADLLLFEFLKIAFWFNPLIYLFQSKLAALHEFIADENTVKASDKKQYFENLLNTAFGTSNISFTNQFFSHSLIKKRIIMLQKHKSSQISKFKFLLIIPVVLSMLFYVACSEDPSDQNDENALQQYNYSVAKGEKLSGDKKATHDKYEEFLLNNPKYVSWATIDYNSDKVNYSVHLESEKVPEGYRKLEVNFKDGQYYTMYMNLDGKGSNSAIASNNANGYGNNNQSTDVPYAVIDQAPAFPGCEKWVDDPRKNCTSSKISEFVNKNFDTSLGKKLGLTGINRVIVQFRIDEQGNIVDVKARAPRKELEEEAIRVISSLPQMTPGEQDGQPVSVMYSLPIAFKVSE